MGKMKEVFMRYQEERAWREAAELADREALYLETERRKSAENNRQTEKQKDNATTGRTRHK